MGAYRASDRGGEELIPVMARNPCQDNAYYLYNGAGSAAGDQKPPRRRRRRTSAQPSARPPDRPPEGGGGVRVPICIDNYLECVLILEVVDVGSTFLHMFATCRQSAFCKDI